SSFTRSSAGLAGFSVVAGLSSATGAAGTRPTTPPRATAAAVPPTARIKSRRPTASGGSTCSPHSGQTGFALSSITGSLFEKQGMYLGLWKPSALYGVLSGAIQRATARAPPGQPPAGRSVHGTDCN